MSELVEELRARADGVLEAAELYGRDARQEIARGKDATLSADLAAHYGRVVLALRAAADRLEAVGRVAGELERDADIGFAAGDEFPAQAAAEAATRLRAALEGRDG